MFSKEFELEQMKINAYVMPECIGCRRKIVTENSNWEIYYNTKYNFCESIAKENSDASNSVYGNIGYIYRQLISGRIKRSQLTKYGVRLLRKNGYNLRAI